MKSTKLILLSASILGMHPCYFPTPLYEITPSINSIGSVKQTGEGQGQICQEQPTALLLCSAYAEQGGGGTSLDFATAESAWRLPGISVQIHDWSFPFGGKDKEVF